MKRQLKAMEINSNIFPEENQFPSVGLKSFSKAKYSARRGGNCKKWFVRSSSPFLLSTSRFLPGEQAVILESPDFKQSSQ